MGTIPTSFALTSLCGPPLLFIYFQVNIGASYYLDHVEDIYDDGGPLCVPVSIFNPNPMYLPLPLPVLYLTHPAVTKVTRSVKYIN